MTLLKKPFKPRNGRKKSEISIIKDIYWVWRHLSIVYRARQAFKSKRADVNEIHFWRLHCGDGGSASWTFSGILNSKSRSSASPIPGEFSFPSALVREGCGFSGDASHLPRMRLLFPPKCFEMRNATLRSQCPSCGGGDVKKLPPLYSYPIWERHPIRGEIWRRLGNFTPHQFGGRLSGERSLYSDGAGLHVDDDNTHQIPADMFGDALRPCRLIENAHLFTSITSEPKGFCIQRPIGTLLAFN
ncbi:hypothetical protein CEXT_568671 [Caerostris extrusa]|uniref:Uncharacterized protein n=1 Tax=Caerostris extrusa TaxID=172846 RepID=A0AAV4USI7_CAEEX|nr:hypothetical protein CEXT_568671 [Caerostris extrusa]